MRRVFKTRYFGRWLRKSGLTDQALCQAVAEMVAGLIDADLGGGLAKKRVGLPGRGKRGGARTLVATNQGSRWFSCSGPGRTSVATSPLMNWKPCKSSLPTCSSAPRGNWMPP